tara:strand:- start:29 stop:679 length:651 start_codon:yes stop_codon:yes gene_type:complete
MSEARHTFLEWLRYDNTLEILSKKIKTKDNLHKDLRKNLVLKLSLLVKGKTCQGVYNNRGEEVLQRGRTYSLKRLNAVDDYVHLTSGTWTTDSLINSHVSELINKYRTLLKNYNITKSAKKLGTSIRAIQKSNTNTKTYLIKNRRNGFYKIGRSINPLKREQTLQSEEPDIVMTKTWDEDIENKLHIEYKDYRIRGEWFELSKAQVKYICTNYERS